MSRFLHISPQEIDFQAGTLFRIVSRNESGVVMCYPGSKIDYNLSVFIDTPSIRKQWLGKYHQRYVFSRIPLAQGTTRDEIVDQIKLDLLKTGLDCHACQSLFDVVRLVEVSGRELYIFLVEVEPILAEQLRFVLDWVHKEMMVSRRIGLLWFTEQNVYRDEFTRLLAGDYKLLQNVAYFPVYSYAESVYFLNALANDFGLTLSDELVDELVQVCGGYLWLLRGLVRRLLDTSAHEVTTDFLYSSTMVQLRVKSIAEQLSDKEMNVMEQIVSGSASASDRSVLQYLINSGVLRHTATGMETSSLLLAEYVRERLESLPVVIREDNQLEYEGREIGQRLTGREFDVMRLLVENRGRIVEREKMAAIIWGQDWEEKYSDWALDKMMSRLRKTLVEEGLPKNSIRTKKGQGFVLR